MPKVNKEIKAKAKNEVKYEVREMKISNEVDQFGKKGITPGSLVGTITKSGMVAPGSTIKIKGRNRKVRCVDLLEDGKRLILVEK